MSTGPRLASTGQRAGAILPVKDEGRQTMSPANSVGEKNTQVLNCRTQRVKCRLMVFNMELRYYVKFII